MFNDRMEIYETKALIDAAGGDTAFGKLLGIDSDEGFQQRVNNWRRRGMPSSVVLEHYEVIQQLKAKMDAERERANSSASLPAHR
ncbi:MAG: hypothetical protein JWO52_4080 [Gammaproteobacteria bacterium]|nr:hypothetical protein [Gammaproteobacteria bacterium]